MNNMPENFTDVNGQWQHFYDEKMKELNPTAAPSPFQRAIAIEYADMKISKVNVAELKFEPGAVHAALKESATHKTVAVKSSVLP